ncbi:MAG: exodeoxyribonuclease I, partial [Aeromonas sp.]
ESRRWRTHCGDYFASHLPEYVTRLEALAAQYQDDERRFALLQQIYLYLKSL